MELLSITPKHICVAVEFSDSEIKDILNILDHANFVYDKKDESLCKADETVRKLYANFKDIAKELGNDT